MSSPVLTVLKYVFLAFLYLFFLRVLRAVWIELREPKTVQVPVGEHGTGDDPSAGPVAVGAAIPADYVDAATVMGMAPVLPVGAGHPGSLPPEARAARVLVTDSPSGAGRTFPLAGELTIGRAAGCGISLPDDTFVSSVHARVFGGPDGYHVEDLGSTNGTFLNDAPVRTAVPLRPGDRLRVGQTDLELVP